MKIKTVAWLFLYIGFYLISRCLIHDGKEIGKKQEGTSQAVRRDCVGCSAGRVIPGIHFNILYAIDPGPGQAAGLAARQPAAARGLT